VFDRLIVGNLERFDKLRKVDKFLEFLASDENWHSIEECARVLKTELGVAKEVIRLLASAGLLECDEEKEVVKIRHDLAELMKGLS